MILRNDFKMNLEANVFGRNSVSVTISIFNNSPKNFYVPQTSVWNSPFYSVLPFHITGPSNIQCYPSPSFHGSDNECFIIEREGQHINTVDITRLCTFQKAKPGEYIIHGHSNFILYESNEECLQTFNANNSKEYVNLSAQGNFTIIDTERDITPEVQMVAESANGVDLL